MTENRLECRDKNECIWQPCGHRGKCINLEHGLTYQCECEGGYTCTNCTCDNLGEWANGNTIGLGREAWAAIVLSILAYISKKKKQFSLDFFIFRNITIYFRLIYKLKYKIAKSFLLSLFF